MFCDRCGKLLNDNDMCDVCDVRKDIKSNNKKGKMSNNGNRIVTVIFSLGILILVGQLSIFWMGIVRNVNKYNDTIKVPYASQTIELGKYNEITSDMISYMEIPNSHKIYLLDHYYGNIDDIIGRCANYTTIIPKGSLFMSNMIIDCEDAKYNSYDEWYADYYGSED